MFTNINMKSIILLFPLILHSWGKWVRLSIPPILWWRWITTLTICQLANRPTPTHKQPSALTHVDNFELSVSLMCVSLDCERKSEYLEPTQIADSCYANISKSKQTFLEVVIWQRYIDPGTPSAKINISTVTRVFKSWRVDDISNMLFWSAFSFSPRTFRKWTNVRVKPEALIVETKEYRMRTAWKGLNIEAGDDVSHTVTSVCEETREDCQRLRQGWRSSGEHFKFRMSATPTEEFGNVLNILPKQETFD